MRLARKRRATVGFHHASIPPRMENTKPLRMNRRTGWKELRNGLALCALMAMSACHRDSPETALRAQLEEMQAAAGDHEIADFMEGVAEDFIGNDGADRAALHNLLRAQVLTRTRIGIASGPLDIEMQDGKAIVRFKVVLTANSTGRGMLPVDAQAYSITSGWREDGGEWHVYYAQWEPAL